MGDLTLECAPPRHLELQGVARPAAVLAEEASSHGRAAALPPLPGSARLDSGSLVRAFPFRRIFMMRARSLMPANGNSRAAGDGGAPAVALRDVRRIYGEGDGSVVALDGVSVGFPRRSFTAIMGPSGSGKSTFLNVAAGLDRTTPGTVMIGDTDLATLSERRLTILRRERIGFVFQAFNLMPSLTVTQNIGLPL